VEAQGLSVNFSNNIFKGGDEPPFSFFSNYIPEYHINS
jgi:hypothetical protein